MREATALNALGKLAAEDNPWNKACQASRHQIQINFLSCGDSGHWVTLLFIFQTSKQNDACQKLPWLRVQLLGQ